jgi:hypothetical protein
METRISGLCHHRPKKNHHQLTNLATASSQTSISPVPVLSKLISASRGARSAS